MRCLACLCFSEVKESTCSVPGKCTSQCVFPTLRLHHWKFSFVALLLNSTQKKPTVTGTCTSCARDTFTTRKQVIETLSWCQIIRVAIVNPIRATLSLTGIPFHILSSEFVSTTSSRRFQFRSRLVNETGL